MVTMRLPDIKTATATDITPSSLKIDWLIDQYWWFATTVCFDSPAFDEWIKVYRREFGEYPSLKNPPVARPIAFAPPYSSIPSSQPSAYSTSSPDRTASASQTDTVRPSLAEAGSPAHEASHHDADHQLPMHGIAQLVGLQDPDGFPSKGRRIRVRPTGTLYAKLPFYAVAKQIIAEAPRPIPGSLQAGCTLILALILAWMRHPFFNQIGERSGQWVALGFDRIIAELRSEVRARNKFIMDCLTALQHSEILQIGNVATHIISQEEYDRLRSDCATLPPDLGGGPGGYLNIHCFNKRTNFYRLKPTITLPLTPSLTLPDSFQPDLKGLNLTPSRPGRGYDSRPEGVGKESGRSQEGVKSTGRGSEGVGKESNSPEGVKKGPGRGQQLLPDSFPTPHDHDYEHEYEYEAPTAPLTSGSEDGTAIKEDRAAPYTDLNTLSESQKQAFQSLMAVHTRFKKEQQPIAENVILDLVKQGCNLGDIERAYKKVAADYQKDLGKHISQRLIRNVIGFFINELLKEIKSSATALPTTASGHSVPRSVVTRSDRGVIQPRLNFENNTAADLSAVPPTGSETSATADQAMGHIPYSEIDYPALLADVSSDVVSLFDGAKLEGAVLAAGEGPRQILLTLPSGDVMTRVRISQAVKTRLGTDWRLVDADK